MPERPLLIFPTPSVAERIKKKIPRGSSRYNFPSLQRQKDRLSSRFESMLQSFVTDSTAGIEPEYVLVLETTGEIEDFERAVRAVSGLEWLAEIDTDELSADEDFFEIPKIGKRLFYKYIDEIRTNQSAEIWNALKDNYLMLRALLSIRDYWIYKLLLRICCIKYKISKLTVFQMVLMAILAT